MRNGAVARHAERGLVRIGLFQPGAELLEVLDLGRDGHADENTELEPRELADRNEILGHCRSKGGILIGIRDEQELAAICPRTASQSAS